MPVYKPVPVVLYRLGSETVYVKPGKDYEEGLDIAYAVFPEELANVSRDRVSFSVVCGGIEASDTHNLRIPKDRKNWVAVMNRMVLGSGIVCLHIEPSSRPDYTEIGPPPPYHEVVNEASLHRDSISSHSSRDPLSGTEAKSRTWIERHFRIFR